MEWEERTSHRGSYAGSSKLRCGSITWASPSTIRSPSLTAPSSRSLDQPGSVQLVVGLLDDPDRAGRRRTARVEGDVEHELADLVAGHAVGERPRHMTLEFLGAELGDQQGDGGDTAVPLGELRSFPDVPEEHARCQLDQVRTDRCAVVALEGRRAGHALVRRVPARRSRTPTYSLTSGSTSPSANSARTPRRRCWAAALTGTGTAASVARPSATSKSLHMLPIVKSNRRRPSGPRSHAFQTFIPQTSPTRRGSSPAFVPSNSASTSATIFTWLARLSTVFIA